MPSHISPTARAYARTTEPGLRGLGLTHEHGRSVRLTHDGVELARYVYEPWDAQLESPRPYFHPVRTLGGDLVTVYRPHDHVWHKGIAWSLPNVGGASFWGGPTFMRDRGYVQLENNGTIKHRTFDEVALFAGAVRIHEQLDWITQQGEAWLSEERQVRAAVHGEPKAWSLAFETRFTNTTSATIAIGSPTTEGRDNAGYGGLFWRGPRAFTGGTVHTQDATGADELMGIRAPWMAFVGKHDGVDRTSTLTFVDAPENPGHPTQWFVRTDPFASVCPGPFFSESVPVAPAETAVRRYAIVIADGDHGRDGSAGLAQIGFQALDAASSSGLTSPEGP